MPKTYTLNRDIHFGFKRNKGDAVTGDDLAALLSRMPHVITETKPETPKKESEVG